MFENDLNSLALPDGWILEYSVNNKKINVILFDLSGQNSVENLDLTFSSASLNSFKDLVLVNENAKQIEYTISNKSHDQEELAPEQYQVYSLYPNPFNPSLNINFSLATPGNINIVVL